MRAFLIVGVLVPVAIMRAQLPAGYHEGPRVSLPDSLREVAAGGRFSISITRSIASASDRQLIERAESLMPPRDSIERIARGVTGAGHVAALQQAAQLPGERWWWREWDGVLLPYALTGAAVLHYIERVRELGGKPNPFARYNPGVDHRASVEYSARVVANGETGRTEARLELKFRFFCGPLCAMSFAHSRVVEFDAAGLPVRVRGDAPPLYAVS